MKRVLLIFMTPLKSVRINHVANKVDNMCNFGKTEGTEKQMLWPKCLSVCLAKLWCVSMSCHCHIHRQQQTPLPSQAVHIFAMITIPFRWCCCYSCLRHRWARQCCQLGTLLTVNKRFLLTSRVPGCGWDAWLMESNASNAKKGHTFYDTAWRNVNTRLMKGIKKGQLLFYIPSTHILFEFWCGIRARVLFALKLSLSWPMTFLLQNLW